MALVPLTGFWQSLFDKYQDLDNVSAVVVNKSMFNLLSKIDVEVDDPEAKDFMDIAQSLNNLNIEPLSLKNMKWKSWYLPID